MSKPRLLACPFCDRKPTSIGSGFWYINHDPGCFIRDEINVCPGEYAAWNCRAPARPASQHGKPGKASRNSKED